MSSVETTPELTILADHLSREVANPARYSDFDMNDDPDADFLKPFSQLLTGLAWLNENVGKPWRKIDQEALRCQARHRFLARVAITSGIAAIILAVVQLSV